MHPQTTPDLSSIASAVQWYVAYSLNHFLPESILLAGFLLAIILDLLLRRTTSKHFTAYFAILVLMAAGWMAVRDWVPFNATQAMSWQGGKVIFPYSQTLFAPSVRQGVMTADYGMAVVDNFAIFFKLLVSVSGVIVILMSLASRELNLRARHFGEYYSLILGMAIGLYLMPASTDLVMMYISLELVSIASYVLAGYSKDRSRSAEASLKYVLFGAFSSGLMLYGFSLLYGLTGATNIVAIRQVLAVQAMGHPTSNQIVLWTATALALAGMGYKISAVPFHFWTPDIYEGAPTPITALLSVASKAAGFGLLIRFTLFVFPQSSTTHTPLIAWPMLLAILSVVTMTIGNFAALLQSNVKRMLAYSSIAHAGYMLIGLVAGGASGIVSVMIYLATYLFMNLGAFYVVMLIENRIGSEELEDYRGLMNRTPLLCASLAIFLISLTGIPLTAGFIGKFYLFTAALKQDPVTHSIPWLWLAVVAIVNSVISMYYYLRVIGAMFLKRPLREVTLAQAGVVHDLPIERISYSIPVKLLLLGLVIPIIALGVYFQPLVDFASGVVRFFDFQDIKF